MDTDGQGCGRAAENAITLTEHAADAEHLRHCPACAAAVRELRAGAEMSPGLEQRLLRDFHDWRDGT